jgi:hypothetical protein
MLISFPGVLRAGSAVPACPGFADVGRAYARRPWQVISKTTVFRPSGAVVPSLTAFIRPHSGLQKLMSGAARRSP